MDIDKEPEPNTSYEWTCNFLQNRVQTFYIIEYLF